jgi:hypothetical protein
VQVGIGDDLVGTGDHDQQRERDRAEQRRRRRPEGLAERDPLRAPGARQRSPVGVGGEHGGRAEERPDPGDEEAPEDIAGVVPFERQERIADGHREGRSERRQRRAEPSRRGEHAAQRQ